MEYPICRFCGQAVNVPHNENATEDELLEIGTMHCKCNEASRYQKTKAAAEKAKLEIDALLENDDPIHNIKAAPPKVRRMLKDAVDMMADLTIRKLSITVSNGGKIDLSINADADKFTVQRSVTTKQKREAQ